MRSRLSILIVVALFASDASAVCIFWDNGLVPNGFSGRALSPPNYPDIRVVDDFTGGGGVLTDARFNILEDDGWIAPENITLEIYADAGNAPGDIVFTYVGPYSRMDTGDEYFGRRDYEYWVEDISVVLREDYWLGVRNPDGSGSGTNYWMTSDGGHHGPGSSTGYFSLDRGNTWNAEGDGWHHAFTLSGIPEPSTGLLLGIGGLVLLRRR